MAEISALNALHYNLQRTGGLQPVTAPPYDVIDPAQRAELAARSPYNVVELDLPVDPAGGDPYAHAARLLAAWGEEGVMQTDAERALWPLEQDYTGPDGERRTRRGVFARIRQTEYGAGLIRPHERTHPGPKEDRLALTRATKTNTSPIFVLHDVDIHPGGDPIGEVTDDDGTTSRLFRTTDQELIDSFITALAPSELLIADGHHRYETARAYAQEIGGEGPHNYVLACLVSLSDPGLTIFPTHRLLTDLDDSRRTALREAIERDWDVAEVELSELEPPRAGPEDPVAIGYLDREDKRPLRMTLRDDATVARALPDRSDAYRRLDTAVTETLLLRGAIGMTEDDISHLNGLEYARSTNNARDRVLAGEVQAALFMGPTPVGLVGDVAAAGEVMPPKSTYFYPKVPTGLLLNPLT